MFSLSHTLFSDQLYKGVFRTVFENRFQEFSDWQAPHEEFRGQGTALEQFMRNIKSLEQQVVNFIQEQA